MEGHQVVAVECLRDAWAAIRVSEFDAIVTDVNLKGESGLELVKKVREDSFEGAVLVMTAYGSVDSAVEAMRMGADDYLTKPVSLDDLSLHITKAIDDRKARSRLRLYERMERTRTSETLIVGESRAWQQTLALARRFSSMPIPRPGEAGELPAVLLLGETGVGKGVVAQYVHRADPTFNESTPAPFVHVNCAALPPSLIESELFGHERGAFTDAKAARTGLFEMAAGGTIFLDEIGEMPLEMQAKLLIVVEKGVFRRVGGSKEHTARSRVVAATNLDLESRVREGRFRRDLLYRLNALTVAIPPLRERENDSVLIARLMLERHGKQQGKPGLTLDAGAEEAIRRHSWPGNVRELINAVKRASILCDPPNVTAEDLGLHDAIFSSVSSTDEFGHESKHPHAQVPSESVNGIPLVNGRLPSVDDMEKMLIIQALRQANGNVSSAAKLIGLNRGALRYRIERLGLESKVREPSA